MRNRIEEEFHVALVFVFFVVFKEGESSSKWDIKGGYSDCGMVEACIMRVLLMLYMQYGFGPANGRGPKRQSILLHGHAIWRPFHMAWVWPVHVTIALDSKWRNGGPTKMAVRLHNGGFDPKRKVLIAILRVRR
ncbi:hypothetical protein FNV43_RR20237 [Rhamnella rubrinervis]|uniref:Uncharacterized protein n=1 Tax=Rhamnella rubrinervis TaxID=2594499 RepID=A0A8K0GT71_9ROSA|nr:hypothetical protein FNV43_RR20237 [Rhamnella rubrinervis]